jgi:hypothetical protein
MPGQVARQLVVARQHLVHRHRVSVQIRQPATALDGHAHIAQIGEPKAAPHGRSAAFVGCQGQDATTVRQPHRPAVLLTGGLLHSGHRVQPEKVQQRPTVERSPAGQPELDRAGRPGCAPRPARGATWRRSAPGAVP